MHVTHRNIMSEETMDEKLAYVMGDSAPSAEETDEPSSDTPETEETKEESTKQEIVEDKGEETPEKPEAEDVAEESEQEETDTQEEPLRKPSRAQKRIQQLVAENKKLKEAQERAGKDLPWHQKEDGEYMELTKDDLNAMISQAVNEKLVQDAKRELVEEWADDYQSTIKENPVLDPDSPEYNKELDDMLATMLTDSEGNHRYDVKVSEAFKKMQKAFTKAKAQGTQDASIRLAVQAEQSALAPSATGENDAEFTWDDMSKLEKTDPEAYFERIRSGNLPKE